MATAPTKAPRSQRRLKAGELEVLEVRLAKEELQRLPRPHLSFYLLLGQAVNEVVMLQSLLIRAQNFKISQPRAIRETSLGLTLFLIRNLCGRIAEARKVINDRRNALLFAELWDALPSGPEALAIRKRAEDARRALNKRLGAGSALVALVRDKLAYHLDQAVMDAGFDATPSNFDLVDFHTGVHGTTFFGISDTVAAVAVSHLTGRPPAEAVTLMGDEALAAVAELQEFANGFMLAFYQTHFGQERLRAGRKVLLQGLPEIERATLGFFMAMPRNVRRPVLPTTVRRRRPA